MQAPDPVLVAAAAMVFVEDLASPAPRADDVHHLLDVLRLRAGEPVVASDGAGRWVPCRLSGARTGTGTGSRSERTDPARLLEVVGPVTESTAPEPAITVGFVPTKGDRPEWVVRRLTELGVDRIVSLRSERSVVRWEGLRAERAVERLRRVSREAAAQSRRTRLPEILSPTPLDGLESLTGLPVRLAQPGGHSPSLDPPLLAVGPEGGWSEDELARHGPGVSLGPTVLRAETAALASAVVLSALRSGIVREEERPLRNHAQ